MQSVAYVGTFYLYAMLAIIVIGLGVLLMRGVDRFAEWIRKPSTAQKKKTETGWVQVVFLSGILLFFSLYSLGVLKTLGVGGDDHDHEEHTADAGSSQSAYSEPPTGAPNYFDNMNQQLNQIEQQIIYLETMMSQQGQRP